MKRFWDKVDKAGPIALAEILNLNDVRCCARLSR